jgi:hypothetical protein
MASSDYTTALIAYGLISDANKAKLEALVDDLFDQVSAGGGGELLSSSVVGRTFNFAPGLSAQDAFTAVSLALRVLNGKSASRTVMRF